MRIAKYVYKNSHLFLKTILPHSVVSIQFQLVLTVHLIPQAFHADEIALEFHENRQLALDVMQMHLRLPVSKFK